ncbi:MAG: hypothetical protein NT154_42215 [Verrucomicrobia bacterium]|nr:hypothetical protein [Verrucomicrobiota bacterium]
MNGPSFNLAPALIGLLCPLIVVGIVITIIVLIVRAMIRAGSGAGGGIPPSLPNVITELGADGFWIVSCPAELGSMIHYHFWAGGMKHAGRVPFQPGGDGRQFVYTGARPEQVSIVSIVQPGDDFQPDLMPPVIGASAVIFGSSSDDQSFSSSAASSPPSFPSAY